MNYLQTKKVFDISKKKNLHIFCCHYYTFHPIFTYLKKIIDEKKLGNPRICMSGFSFKNNFNNDQSYRSKKKLGASSILDLGFYPLSLEYFLFKNYKKNIVSSNINNFIKLKFDLEGNVLISSKEFQDFIFGVIL